MGIHREALAVAIDDPADDRFKQPSTVEACAEIAPRRFSPSRKPTEVVATS